MEKQFRHYRFSMLIAEQIYPVDLPGLGGFCHRGLQVQFEEGEIQGRPWSWENGLWHKPSHCSQRLSGFRLNSPFPRILITLGHTLRLFAKLIKTNMGKLLEAGPTISQLLKVPTQQLKGRRGANSSCFVWHGGLRKFERQMIQNKKQCKNRLGNYCAVTINEAIENINHSLTSEACCERRIRRFYVPSTRKPQGPGA